MSDISKLQLGAQVSGKDINDWCWDQILHHRAYIDEARKLINKRFGNGCLYEVLQIDINIDNRHTTALRFAKVK